MRTNFRSAVRSLAVVLALGFAAAPAADASLWSGTRTEAAPRRQTLWGLPRDDPAIAFGAIVGGLALLIAFVWIAVRVGDKH